MLSCIIELLDVEYMIHCIVSSRPIYKSDSCDHSPLVVILYVLSEVYNGLVHDFPGIKAVCSLMRCPSTIGDTCINLSQSLYI